MDSISIKSLFATNFISNIVTKIIQEKLGENSLIFNLLSLEAKSVTPPLDSIENSNLITISFRIDTPKGGSANILKKLK